jgi:lipopolysaccharide export LptBFGC system permease protein LptF
MTHLGHHIRRWASRVFSPLTMARVIDPTLADLQLEYARACAAERPWRARWIRFAGYLTCLRAVALHVSLSAWSAFRDPSAEERRLAHRVIATTAICLVLVAALFAGVPMIVWLFSRDLPSGSAWLTIALIPQALPRAIPVALAVGVALAIGGQSISRYVVGIVCVLAFSGAAVSFAALGWAAPVSNQAFRIAASWTGPKGDAELTLGELRRSVLWVGSQPHARISVPGAVVRVELAYHRRLALPMASIVLAAVLLARRRTGSRFNAASHAAMASGWYFGLLTAASLAAVRGAMPALAAVWLPNVLFLAAAGALRLRSRFEAEHRTVGV